MIETNIVIGTETEIVRGVETKTEIETVIETGTAIDTEIGSVTVIRIAIVRGIDEIGIAITNMIVTVTMKDVTILHATSALLFPVQLYAPRLAQRTQQRSRRGDGDEDDDRYEDVMRRKQLQDELGLSDEEELTSGKGDMENGGTPSRNNNLAGGDNEARAHIKELQRDLKEARSAEQKAQESLSKLQLLSKSQTAILKTSMSKKIQQKEALVEDMTNVIKELERKLTEAGVTFEAYNIPDAARLSTGRSNATSDNEAEVEINAMKTEMERLIEENGALKAAATKTNSSESKPPSPADPPTNMVNKAALESVEAEKRQMMRQMKDMQQQLAALKSAAASSPPAPPTPPAPENSASSNSSNAEELQTLKNKLTTVEASHQNAQKTIQRLEKELAAASTSRAVSTPEPVTVTAQGPSKLETELQAQIRDMEPRLTELQTQLEQQKRDSKAKETTADERYAKLKSTAEGELNKIKEQAKKAILDLKRKLEVASKGQQRKQATIVNLSAQLRAQRTDLVTLKSQVSAQQQQVPVLAKQLTEKIMQRVQKQADAMAGVVDNYKREMKERKRLFNLVQELKGNIRVLCRVRPISKNEIAQGSKMICKFASEEITLSGEKGKVKTWEFDHVFDMGSSQDQLFSQVKPLVTSILDGYSVCIFAYGQTGSGKTFTMSGPPENPGINTRSLQELFERKGDRVKEYQDEITVSIMEIYNEQIRDLLAQDAVNTNLQVRQGPTGNFVPGLTVVPVQTLDEVFELIKRGNKNRSTHATDMNEHSSRSHSILSIQLKSLNIVTNVVASGKLFLVDLAGSERLSKTGAEGLRLKEAQNINKSLSALGDVIAARASKQKHVPYRNSSLTYLLQDALGGDSKTLMVACASPVDYNSEETFCTLNFAARTRSVEMGKATKNVAQAT
ncbi:Kinesin-like protein [Phytophthora palmivora]|uniref:Kinesin-like protein n=1 Tax=Phytophthora palmivora TaxID=4796 RepID=A0A2P4YEE8_9STRA|nr:Kinesin-like protein [Phytophthora palmivora]